MNTDLPFAATAPRTSRRTERRCGRAVQKKSPDLAICQTTLHPNGRARDRFARQERSKSSLRETHFANRLVARRWGRFSVRHNLEPAIGCYAASHRRQADGSRRHDRTVSGLRPHLEPDRSAPAPTAGWSPRLASRAGLIAARGSPLQPTAGRRPEPVPRCASSRHYARANPHFRRRSFLPGVGREIVGDEGARTYTCCHWYRGVLP